MPASKLRTALICLVLLLLIGSLSAIEPQLIESAFSGPAAIQAQQPEWNSTPSASKSPGTNASAVMSPCNPPVSGTRSHLISSPTPVPYSCSDTVMDSMALGCSCNSPNIKNCTRKIVNGRCEHSCSCKVPCEAGASIETNVNPIPSNGCPNVDKTCNAALTCSCNPPLVKNYNVTAHPSLGCSYTCECRQGAAPSSPSPSVTPNGSPSPWDVCCSGRSGLRCCEPNGARTTSCADLEITIKTCISSCRVFNCGT